jgi:DedD protein
MKRAGLAVAVALVLLIAMLWFGDSGQPPRPLPEPASTVPQQPDAAIFAPETDTSMLPESDTAAQTASVTEETGYAPDATPGLDAGVDPDTTALPEPIKADVNPKAAANKPAPPPKAVDVPTESISLTDGYFVQLGVFDDTENVDKVLNNVAELGLPARIQSRVVVGPFRNKREAEAARNRLKDIAEGTVLPPQKTAKAPEKPKAKPKSRQRAK